MDKKIEERLKELENLERQKNDLRKSLMESEGSDAIIQEYENKVNGYNTEINTIKSTIKLNKELLAETKDQLREAKRLLKAFKPKQISGDSFSSIIDYCENSIGETSTAVLKMLKSYHNEGKVLSIEDSVKGLSIQTKTITETFDSVHYGDKDWFKGKAEFFEDGKTKSMRIVNQDLIAAFKKTFKA